MNRHFPFLLACENINFDNLCLLPICSWLICVPFQSPLKSLEGLLYLTSLEASESPDYLSLCYNRSKKSGMSVGETQLIQIGTSFDFSADVPVFANLKLNTMRFFFLFYKIIFAH